MLARFFVGSGSNDCICRKTVSTPLSRYACTRRCISVGPPWMNRSSMTCSGTAATAALRSPAAQASHMGCSNAVRPSHSWNALYTGTFK